MGRDILFNAFQMNCVAPQSPGLWSRADPHRSWTVRQVAEHVAVGGIGPVVAGSIEAAPPATRYRWADQLAAGPAPVNGSAT